MESEYLERIISIQKEQLDRYHEYVLCALNNANNSSRHTTNFLNSSDTIPLFEYIQSNLDALSEDRILKYMETTDINGLIGLVDTVLCPDKQNLNFSLQSNSSFVKYKLSDGNFIIENIQDFSVKVCGVIQRHCEPFIVVANDENYYQTEIENGEDIVLDTLCGKNIQRVKNFSTLKFMDTQIRLVKKVFSGLKTK